MGPLIQRPILLIRHFVKCHIELSHVNFLEWLCYQRISYQRDTSVSTIFSDVAHIIKLWNTLASVYTVDQQWGCPQNAQLPAKECWPQGEISFPTISLAIDDFVFIDQMTLMKTANLLKTPELIRISDLYIHKILIMVKTCFTRSDKKCNIRTNTSHMAIISSICTACYLSNGLFFVYE